MNRESKTYKEEYLKNLQREIANIQTNERGNMNFKQFGTSTPNSLPDNRTGVEKMGDTQRVINEVKKGLLEIMEPDYMTVVVNDLQKNTKILEFVYAKMPYIQRKLKEKYKKESLTPALFNEELDNFINKDVIGLMRDKLLPVQADVEPEDEGGDGGDDGNHGGFGDLGEFEDLSEYEYTEREKEIEAQIKQNDELITQLKRQKPPDNDAIRQLEQENVELERELIGDVDWENAGIKPAQPAESDEDDVSSIGSERSGQSEQEPEPKLTEQQQILKGHIRNVELRIQDLTENHPDEGGQIQDLRDKLEQLNLAYEQLPNAHPVAQVEAPESDEEEEEEGSQAGSQAGAPEPEEQIPTKPKAGEPEVKAEFATTYQTYDQLQKFKGQPAYKTASPENKLEIQLRLKGEIDKKIKRGETVTKKVKTGNLATIEALEQEIASKKPSAGKGLKPKPIKHIKEEIKQIEIKPIFNHDRFEILKGEIIAGNDSKDILKEFKKMLHDAVRKRLMTHEELEEYLEEIDVN